MKSDAKTVLKQRNEKLIELNLPTACCPVWDWFCLPMTSRNDGKSKVSSSSDELQIATKHYMYTVLYYP